MFFNKPLVWPSRTYYLAASVMRMNKNLKSKCGMQGPPNYKNDFTDSGDKIFKTAQASVDVAVLGPLPGKMAVYFNFQSKAQESPDQNQKA